ncbi:MAG: Rid family hydrolase [Pseudomonadota bacterium]
MSVRIDKVNPPSLPDAPAMGYSQITVADPGRLIFMSGQVAWTPDGAPPPDALYDQAKIAMENVIKGLEAVEAGPQNITSIRMYVVNPSTEDFHSVAPVLSEFMEGALPTFTALGVNALAGEGLKIELEVTAVA